MKDTNLVSAIITTHERLTLLKKAIESVERQTYSNMELIVVDDASADGTKEYMEKYTAEHPSVQYIYIPKSESRGGNYARNTGVRHAKGEYVALLDDDDEWMPEKTAEQAAYLDEHPEVGTVSCARIVEYDMKERVEQVYPALDTSNMKVDIFRNLRFTTSGLMYRRKLLFDVGLFDEELRYWQEYELLIRLCQIAGLGYLETPLYLFRMIAKDKKRLSNNVAGWYDAVQYIENKHSDIIAALPDEVRKTHYLMIARDGATRAEKCNASGEKRKYLWKVFKLEPTPVNLVKVILNKIRLRR